MRVRSVLAVLAVVAAGCGSQGSDSTVSTTMQPVTTAATTLVPSPTVVPTTTILATTTTTTVPASTTTAPPDVPFSVSTNGVFPDPLPDSGGAHGSGCVAGGDALPDGVWFGFAQTLVAGSIGFDLACFFTGEAAQSARAQDGETEELDYYIRNNSGQVRSVVLDQGGAAYWLDATGDLTPQQIPMTDWPSSSGTSYQECPGAGCAVWLFVNDGIVTELLEQYLP